MLKKVHVSKSLSYIQNNETDLQCLPRNGYSDTILCESESASVSCAACRSIEMDETPEIKPRRQMYHRRNTKPVPSLGWNNNKEHEMASGDIHKHEFLEQDEYKRDIKYGSNLRQYETNKNDNLMETTIEYKNNNFVKSIRCENSSLKNITSYRNEKVYKERESSSLARPVLCPVTTCGRMLAVDSISQHFYFDHSKIANMTLRRKKTLRIIQKSYIFTNDTQCIAVFVHNCPPSTSLEQISYADDNFNAQNQSLLLLMCAVISLNTINNSVKTNSIYVKNSEEKLREKAKYFNNNHCLLFWLCKTSSNSHSYKITLSREDKQLSYSFTGEPIHIRDSQDASSIYDSTNCLNLRGIAANRLLDKHQQFHIFVSII